MFNIPELVYSPQEHPEEYTSFPVTNYEVFPQLYDDAMDLYGPSVKFTKLCHFGDEYAFVAERYSADYRFLLGKIIVAYHEESQRSSAADIVLCSISSGVLPFPLPLWRVVKLLKETYLGEHCSLTFPLLMERYGPTDKTLEQLLADGDIVRAKDVAPEYLTHYFRGKYL